MGPKVQGNVKVVILAGGAGTRLAEETETKPKPMVEIGGRPILWHIMKHYSHYGFNEFLIALGYKGEAIKRYFLDYRAMTSDITVNLATGDFTVHSSPQEDWTVHLVDTGPDTLTGGRIKRLEPWLRDGTFMLTWGDGVSDVDLRQLLQFHRSHGRLATVTAVHPPSRFGRLHLDGGNLVTQFSEKPSELDSWINGAFFVLEPGVLDYIQGDDTQWEHEPLERLAKEGQLVAYLHNSFWQCMDTLHEKRFLEKLWASGRAPWKIWR